jgi:hypothetical protein
VRKTDAEINGCVGPGTGKDHHDECRHGTENCQCCEAK